ncbi:unnamed protein product [Darwinula stevensoni]|uniref:Uncharacterized protein n=1 Tax=Darwinula stevensoni TaxID=69355 RepID=A0A7R8X480_9CRUS|nr:unnamed protein product [Darwinula stevensoni]CAG0883180.1 unnamed protein product [Darwinula stevensoni]
MDSAVESGVDMTFDAEMDFQDLEEILQADLEKHSSRSPNVVYYELKSRPVDTDSGPGQNLRSLGGPLEVFWRPSWVPLICEALDRLSPILSLWAGLMGGRGKASFGVLLSAERAANFRGTRKIVLKISANLLPAVSMTTGEGADCDAASTSGCVVGTGPSRHRHICDGSPTVRDAVPDDGVIDTFDPMDVNTSKKPQSPFGAKVLKLTPELFEAEKLRFMRRFFKRP